MLSRSDICSGCSLRSSSPAGRPISFEIWTIWHPVYGLQGAIKLITAAASVATAIAVWGLMPRALALPSPSQYLEVRTALTSEIEQRQQVSEVLAETEQRYELLIESVTDYAIISP